MKLVTIIRYIVGLTLMIKSFENAIIELDFLFFNGIDTFNYRFTVSILTSIIVSIIGFMVIYFNEKSHEKIIISKLTYIMLSVNSLIFVSNRLIDLFVRKLVDETYDLTLKMEQLDNSIIFHSVLIVLFLFILSSIIATIKQYDKTI